MKASYVHFISDVRWTSAGVGVMGVMGNKGGVVSRFQIHETSICFICAHLAANRENITARNSDFRSINDKAVLLPEKFARDILEERNKARPVLLQRSLDEFITISDHDIIFWIGDFNYRIDVALSREEIFEFIERQDIATLRTFDQLNIERQHRRVFQDFQEGELIFNPTYKYQAGTDMYDIRPDKKLRPPAWCDRVLWKVNDKGADGVYEAKLLEYRRCELRPSDHKPISALFDCNVRKIIPEKELDMYFKYIRQLDKMENDVVPKVHIGPAFETVLPRVNYEVNCVYKATNIHLLCCVSSLLGQKRSLVCHRQCWLIDCELEICS